MTISLPSSAKFALSGVLGLGGKSSAKKSTRDLKRAPLERHELAKLFAPEMESASLDAHRTRKLNKVERKDHDTLSDLRGALYSRD